MNVHGSENFRIISSRSQLKSDWSIHNAGVNRNQRTTQDDTAIIDPERPPRTQNDSIGTRALLCHFTAVLNLHFISLNYT